MFENSTTDWTKSGLSPPFRWTFKKLWFCWQIIYTENTDKNR